MSRHGRAITLLVILVGLFLTGCGPIEYVNQVTRRASSDLAAAKSANADKHAPYWYTLATEYLQRARWEGAHADFQAANRFGRRASDAARMARKIAIDKATDDKVAPLLEKEAEP